MLITAGTMLDFDFHDFFEISSLVLFHGDSKIGRGLISFSSLALLFLAAWDKLVWYSTHFSSINWSRIALLLCLDATQFYWEQLFVISQIYRLPKIPNNMPSLLLMQFGQWFHLFSHFLKRKSCIGYTTEITTRQPTNKAQLEVE